MISRQSAVIFGCADVSLSMNYKKNFIGVRDRYIALSIVVFSVGLIWWAYCLHLQFCICQPNVPPKHWCPTTSSNPYDHPRLRASNSESLYGKKKGLKWRVVCYLGQTSLRSTPAWRSWQPSGTATGTPCSCRPGFAVRASPRDCSPFRTSRAAIPPGRRRGGAHRVFSLCPQFRLSIEMT